MSYKFRHIIIYSILFVLLTFVEYQLIELNISIYSVGHEISSNCVWRE